MKWCHLYIGLLITLPLCACNNDLDSVDTVSNPIPAPTATTIVYTSDREESFHLRISNSDYSKSYRLTSFGLAVMPDWSPEKQWITYTKNFQIWKMRYDGTEKTLLTPDGLPAQASRFSPDGNTLVFAVTQPHEEGVYTLYTVRSDGSQLQQVIADNMVAKTGHYSFIWPDWSSDGKKICFSYARLDTNLLQSYIGIFNLETKTFTRLPWINANLLPAEPRWSPRRDELLVTCYLREGGIDIWRVNIDGSDPTPMTHTKRSRAPAWAADGEYFLYENHITEVGRTMWRMKRNGSENKQIIIDNHSYGGDPTW
jgi:Tol biopolymer transport system component